MFTLLFIIPRTVLLSSIQAHSDETVTFPAEKINLGHFKIFALKLPNIIQWSLTFEFLKYALQRSTGLDCIATRNICLKQV